MKFPEADDLTLNDMKPIQEDKGSLESQTAEEKLLHSVIENDEQTIDDGKLVLDSVDQGVSSFMPDVMFEKLTQNYANAEKLYGDRLIKLLTGYDSSYVKKNIHIPEFVKALQAAISAKSDELKKKGLINDEREITDAGSYLASLILYTQELDRLSSLHDHGMPNKKRIQGSGSPDDCRIYRPHDPYRNVDIRKSLRNTIRRGHTVIQQMDLSIAERRDKKHVEIVYAIDASGSMRGEKIAAAKRAGVALAYHAINRGDSVGLVIFGIMVKDSVRPCKDFRQLLDHLVLAKASSETNLSDTINHAAELFSSRKCAKQIILLTDAVPTTGKNPAEESITAASNAHGQHISVSIIGIKLDAEGELLARQIIQAGNGRLYSINNTNNLDCVILQEYDAII